jgi:hypothetical protein
LIGVLGRIIIKKMVELDKNRWFALLKSGSYEQVEEELETDRKEFLIHATDPNSFN